MSNPISPDTKIGDYIVVSKLGEGGMGEVWRARDSKLGREVAIKVLPPAFSSDSERLKRFEQEAQAAGSLNHPNILVIYHIGTHVSLAKRWARTLLCSQRSKATGGGCEPGS